MKRTNIVIPFKGERRYLQGPDLYNAAIDILGREGDPKYIEFNARRFINVNEVVIESMIITDAPKADCSASMRGIVNNVEHLIMMNPGRETSEFLTIQFDEAILRDCIAVSGTVASYSARQPFSPMEILVSMKKLLLEKLFPDENVKWVFVRASLSHNIQDVSSAIVRCLTESPSRIYQSLVEINGMNVGRIYFIGAPAR